MWSKSIEPPFARILSPDSRLILWTISNEIKEAGFIPVATNGLWQTAGEVVAKYAALKKFSTIG